MYGKPWLKFAFEMKAPGERERSPPQSLHSPNSSLSRPSARFAGRMFIFPSSGACSRAG